MPVVTIEPKVVDFRNLGCNEVLEVPVTFTNHGLIAAENLDDHAGAARPSIWCRR